MLQLDRKTTEVVHTYVGRYLRQKFPRHADKFVEVFSKLTGRLIVGVWESKSAGRVRELMAFWHPAEFDRASVAAIGAILHVGTRAETRRITRSILQRGTDYSDIEEHSRENDDRRKYVRRKLNQVRRDHPALNAIDLVR